MNRPEILELFAAQHGVATACQLAASGASRRSVDRARGAGVLVKVLPGLFRTAGTTMTFQTRAMAALLHFGSNSFLDGVSAGSLQGLRGMPTGRVALTVHGRITVVVPPWIVASRTTWVVDGDVVTRRDGFRLAGPLRMLLGLAATFNRHQFERAAEDAWHLRLVTPEEAAAYLERVRRPGRKGVATFDRWLSDALPRSRPSASGLEAKTMSAVRLAGLPEPVRQHPLELRTGEVIHLDLAWPDVRLAVEPGHSWWHGGNLRMRADYARDRACGELGWHVIRFDESMADDIVGAGRQINRIYDARLGVA